MDSRAVSATTVTASVKLESQLSWSNNGLVKEREELPFQAPFDQAQLYKVLDVSLDVYSVVGVGNLNELFGRTGERIEGCAAIPAARLGGKAARACKNARLNGRDLAEQGHELQIGLSRFASYTGCGQEACPVMLDPIDFHPRTVFKNAPHDRWVRMHLGTVSFKGGHFLRVEHYSTALSRR